MCLARDTSALCYQQVDTHAQFARPILLPPFLYILHLYVLLEPSLLLSSNKAHRYRSFGQNWRHLLQEINLLKTNKRHYVLEHSIIH